MIGAGASGTLVAAQFDRLAPLDARLVLIGDQPRPARGVAYDTPYQTNLLNVPAGNMSAFPNDVEHFTRWLAKHLPGSNAATFAPRKLYGNYLLNLFMKLRKYSNKIDYLNTEVIDITRQDGLWFLELANGNVVKAYSVVLAVGNSLPPADPIDFRAAKSHYFRNPWTPEATKDLPAEAPILLIGTGLTMVDVALALRETGHRGPIHAISRHGRLSQTHKSYEPRCLNELPADFHSPHGALRWIRARIKKEEQTGNNWRAVIDSLRPHTAAIWQGWSLQQRSSFLRHARNLWDVHRHRIAPEIYERLSILVEDRELTLHQDSLVSAAKVNDGIAVAWKDRKTSELKTLHVARVINCTGPSRDLEKTRSSLISKLFHAGWISADALKLGLETDLNGRLFDKHGNVAPGLYTLGPLRIAGLWESVAIPEIRSQALELVKLLIKEYEAARIPIQGAMAKW
ncbi:MAG TPA: FAD/NAD(P)-binding protein [Anaerolineales bacterium]|nr:FAD/NAD(P)-binding protein [Anaerolineales bacterium]